MSVSSRESAWRVALVPPRCKWALKATRDFVVVHGGGLNVLFLVQLIRQPSESRKLFWNSRMGPYYAAIRCDRHRYSIRGWQSFEH